MTYQQLKSEFEFENISEYFECFIGMSQTDLLRKFSINSSSKSINNLIVNKMIEELKIDLKKKLSENCVVTRTVRIQYGGIIKESLPFSPFKYEEIVLETWASSHFRNMLLTTKFLFFIFKERKGEYYFSGIKIWNLTIADIDNKIKKVWDKTKTIIEHGEIVSYISNDGIRKTNFPSMSENEICHVRPHARNKNDTFPLPVIDKVTGENKYTKHCFWINASYLNKILKEFTI